LGSYNISIIKPVRIIDDFRSRLTGNPLQKLSKSQVQNPDYLKFTSDDNEYEFKRLVHFAPLFSVPVERSFSQYRRILNDRSESMIESTIEYHNVIDFNKFLINN